MSEKTNTISVIGLGYIGLPTAAIIASQGKKVIGIDINEKIVELIKSKKIHIIENGLEVLVEKVVEEGFLEVGTFPLPADVFLITVPTPIDTISKKPVLNYVFEAVDSISKVLKKDNLIILESTVPIGTTRELSIHLSKLRPDLKFPHEYGDNSDVCVAHCPERVLPGNIILELKANNRVIGGLSNKCTKKAIELYNYFVSGECIGASSAEVAEMSKLTENSFRDMNIAFANELSILCDEIGVDVWELISHANRHPRVDILQPGPGVGGHCIAVDPWFLVASSAENTKLIQLSRDINDNKPQRVVEKFKKQIELYLKSNSNKDIKKTSVAIYGLSFKPDIDDLRESPALEIVKKIISDYEGEIIIYEPNISALPNELNKALLGSLSEIRETDFSLLLVDHKEFKSLQRPNGLLIDTRGIWVKSEYNNGT